MDYIRAIWYYIYIYVKSCQVKNKKFHNILLFFWQLMFIIFHLCVWWQANITNLSLSTLLPVAINIYRHHNENFGKMLEISFLRHNKMFRIIYIHRLWDEWRDLQFSSFTFFMYLFHQDEFRRWFLARVRVMLAPGSDPFHSLETQTTSPCSPSSPSCPFSSPASPSLANGHTTHPSDGSPAQELIRRFAEYQPTQVGARLSNVLYLHTYPSVGLYSW